SAANVTSDGASGSGNSGGASGSASSGGSSSSGGSGGAGGAASGGTATSGGASNAGGSGGTSATGDCQSDADCDDGLVCYDTIGCSRVCTEPDPVLIESEDDLVALADRSCDVLDGSLWIQSATLSDLSALAPNRLAIVTGDLSLSDNSVLEDISAVAGLKTVRGTLAVMHNPMLVDLKGLQTLEVL